MDQVNKKYIDCMCILKEYVMMIDMYYPIEIIKLIMMCMIDEHIMISCGSEHGFLISPFNNKIYVWGENTYGQLGLGWTDKYKQISLQEFIWDKKPIIREIICGKFHTIALTNIYNKVYVWGKNTYGQLGLGHCNDINSPQELILKELHDKDERIISASCGYDHTIILVKSAIMPYSLCKAYVCGRNGNGQLGLGHRNVNKDKLQELILCDSTGRPESFTSIKCGYSHVVSLTTSGKTYVWGRNYEGQLGLGHGIDQSVPQELILPNEQIVSISCGQMYTVVLSASYNVYTCGDNERGQLGLGHRNDKNVLQQVELSNVVSISSGNCYTLALTKWGEIFYWGSTFYYCTSNSYYMNSDRPLKTFLVNVVSIHCGWTFIIHMKTNGDVNGLDKYSGASWHPDLGRFPMCTSSSRLKLF